LVSAATLGALLFVLFAGIVAVAQETLLSNRRAELATALNTFTLDPTESFDLREFKEAYPELSCAIFEKDGHKVGSIGSLRLPATIGIGDNDGFMTYGKEFQGHWIVVGTRLRDIRRSIRLLTLVLGGLLPLLTLLVGFSTWLTARAVFRPLERITSQAAEAAGSDLSERLATDDRFEFGELARELNGMLDRIESEVQRSERFAADAAHELRTPLAILRTRLETALLNPRSREEYVEALRGALSEIGRLTDVTQSLLSTARGTPSEATPLAIGPVVIEAINHWDEDFRKRDLLIVSDVESVSALVQRDELRIVLDNLLENAMRFAPSGSEVAVSATPQGAFACLEVVDHGPGFSAELGNCAFDRLVRGDSSRNREFGGAGIGLSVVRRIAESRGGSAFHRQTPGGGATVVVRFPLVERNLSN
jgi:signal transduction histidine kinase